MAKKETTSLEKLAESFGLDPEKIKQEKENATKLQKEEEIKKYENKDNSSFKQNDKKEKQGAKPNDKNFGSQGGQLQAKETKNTTSPYNFIPVNDKVVASDFTNDKYPHDKFHDGLYSGKIEIEIEAITDIFTAGEQTSKNDEKPKKFDFYKCGDKYAIPGSSLRGMIRNLLEIVSYAKFNMTDTERKLYFRSFATNYKKLRDYYNEKIKFEENGKTIKRANSGFLNKSGKDFYIYPTVEKFKEVTFDIQKRDGNTFGITLTYGTEDGDNPKGTNSQYLVTLTNESKVIEIDNPKILETLRFYRDISKSEDSKFIILKKSNYNTIKNIKERFEYLAVVYDEKSKKYLLNIKQNNLPNNQNNNRICLLKLTDDNKVYEYNTTCIDVTGKHKYDNDRKIFNDLPKVQNFIVAPSEKNVIMTNEYLMYGGYMDSKKTHYLISKERKTKEKLPIHKEVLRNYRLDNARNGPNLITFLREKKSPNAEIPCFYFTDNSGNVTSFAHIPMMRLSYENKIFDDVLQADKSNEQLLDIPTAIFGDKNKFMTRVFFEDAIISSEPKTEEKDILLGTPNPTSIFMYLEQPDGDIKHYLHYDSEGARIRGYKRYWLYKDNVIKNLPSDPIKDWKKEMHTKINLIKKGAKFVGTIKFENLQDYELGALLFVLKLKDDLYTNIGMGKPLGLGVIKIKPILFIKNTKERYSSFENSGYEKIENFDTYINNFEKYVLEKLNEKDKNSIWELPRIKQLETMLKLYEWKDCFKYIGLVKDKYYKLKVPIKFISQECK